MRPEAAQAMLQKLAEKKEAMKKAEAIAAKRRATHLARKEAQKRASSSHEGEEVEPLKKKSRGATPTQKDGDMEEPIRASPLRSIPFIQIEDGTPRNEEEVEGGGEGSIIPFRPAWNLQVTDSALSNPTVARELLTKGMLPKDRSIIEAEEGGAFISAAFQGLCQGVYWGTQAVERYAKTANLLKSAVEKGQRYKSDLSGVTSRLTEVLGEKAALELRATHAEGRVGELGTEVVSLKSQLEEARGMVEKLKAEADEVSRASVEEYKKGGEFEELVAFKAVAAANAGYKVGLRAGRSLGPGDDVFEGVMSAEEMASVMAEMERDTAEEVDEVVGDEALNGGGEDEDEVDGGAE